MNLIGFALFVIICCRMDQARRSKPVKTQMQGLLQYSGIFWKSFATLTTAYHWQSPPAAMDLAFENQVFYLLVLSLVAATYEILYPIYFSWCLSLRLVVLLTSSSDWIFLIIEAKLHLLFLYHGVFLLHPRYPKSIVMRWWSSLNESRIA